MLTWRPRTVKISSGEWRMVREKREWEQIGVMEIHSMEEYTIGPPALMAYAVEPVGVAKINPSAR